MKVKSLVKIIKVSNGGIHITFFRPTFSLPYAAKNMEHATEVAHKLCSDNIDYEGRPWINSWSKEKDNKKINCPEGYIKLPIDLWCCKLSKEMCSLQANIPLDNKDQFLDGCHANEQRKEDIFNTVSNGKYDGFHHVPGRYLCVACENKKKKTNSFSYHYPWEFAELDIALGKSYEETRVILTKKSLPSTYVSCPLCASCCNEIATKIDPSLTAQLKVLEFDVNFRA